MTYSYLDIASFVDHTLLKADITEQDIYKLCDEGLQFNVASICIPPTYVKRASRHINKQDLKICTVVGFPNGYNTAKIKMLETEKALEDGVSEIDMVVNIGEIKSAKFSRIYSEINNIKKICKDNILKVIIETCLLTDYEKQIMCDVIYRAGANYIKTSTGFSNSGATFKDIVLLRNRIGSRNLKIKASGGITTYSDAIKFIELGANRIGTSRMMSWVK